MKRMIPGIILGGIYGSILYLSQTLFPENKSPFLNFTLYLIFFISLFISGFWHKKTGGGGGGIRIGILTSVILFAMILLIYRLTGTVSGRTRVFPWGLPVAVFLGAVFGGMGGLSAAFLAKNYPDRLMRIMHVFRLFVPYAIAVTSFTGLLYLLGSIRYGAAFSGYGLFIGWLIALVTLLFVIVIWDLLYRSENRKKS